MKPTAVYALVDPRNNEIRYIGKSERPASRHAHHCRGNDRTYNANWIKSIRPLKPTMIVLEVVMGEGWAEAEQFWISYFRFLGARLTNLTSGGEGSVGFRHSPESIAKIKAAKSNPSLETRAKISQANKSRSPESVAKMAASKRGKKISPETRAKMSLAAKGKKKSAEARANMSAGRRNMTAEAKAAMHAKISESQKGKTVSEETRAKLRGRAVSPETIEKLRIAGRNISEETRAKQSASAKARHERERAASSAPPL